MLPAKNITSDPNELDPVTLARVITKVHNLTGITMNDHKKSLLQSRLKKRMRELSIATYPEYMDFLDKTNSEVQSFINAVTTNETTFFRTPKVWNYFRDEFLPEWHAKNPKATLSLWSAASSSGEEAYSMAILCSEFKMKNPGFDFKILATDISTAVLDEAMKGVYSERSVEFLKKSMPELFARYFKQDGEFHLVSGELKRKVSFLPHNLYTVKKEMFDIVFLRNVLIYFSGEDQEKVLWNISKSLKDNSALIIGESESLTRLNTPYDFKSSCIYGFKGQKTE